MTDPNTNPKIRFFAQSSSLDYLILRPLSHITMNWELTWDRSKDNYATEPNSFAASLNKLVEEIAETETPPRYHDHEDRLAEFVRDEFNWPIHKVANRWVGAEYDSILENGGHRDLDEKNLVLAATGRVQAAIDRDQLEFDDVEESHQKMLAAVLTIILYHRLHEIDSTE